MLGIGSLIFGNAFVISGNGSGISGNGSGISGIHPVISRNGLLLTKSACRESATRKNMPAFVKSPTHKSGQNIISPERVC
jgi:hypothetical protein